MECSFLSPLPTWGHWLFAKLIWVYFDEASNTSVFRPGHTQSFSPPPHAQNKTSQHPTDLQIAFNLGLGNRETHWEDVMQKQIRERNRLKGNSRVGGWWVVAEGECGLLTPKGILTPLIWLVKGSKKQKTAAFLIAFQETQGDIECTLTCWHTSLFDLRAAYLTHISQKRDSLFILIKDPKENWVIDICIFKAQILVLLWSYVQDFSSLSAEASRERYCS